VLHHILSNLTAQELAPLRTVSVGLYDPATSNLHWRRLLLSDLIPSHSGLYQINTIPGRLWSFSLISNGWFRAYCEVKRIINEPWLKTEKDLADSVWTLYFKQHCPDLSIGDYHSIVCFLQCGSLVPLSGLPLPSRNWKVQDGAMLSSCTPKHTRVLFLS
jgi:hypothetical protein